MSEEIINVDAVVKTDQAENEANAAPANTEPLINRTTTIQLNPSLNIVMKKPPNVLSSNSSIFIVPSQNQSANEASNLNQLINAFSPPNSEPKSNLTANKIINLASLKTTTVVPNSVTGTRNVLAGNTKKVIINTSQSGCNPITPINSTADNKAVNTITLTKASSGSFSNSLNQPISVQLATANANKIQYVKIVNTGNNTQQVQMHQQTIPATINKAIKITTITSNPHSLNSVCISSLFLKNFKINTRKTGITNKKDL